MIAHVLRFCCPFAKYVWGEKYVTERSVKKVQVSTVTCERILEECQMTVSFLDKNKIQKLLFTSDKTWFMLSIKNHKYWRCEKPHAVHEVYVHDLEIWSLVCSECTQIRKGRGF
jgi:hypothetical protein